jgi:hypothetical protein
MVMHQTNRALRSWSFVTSKACDEYPYVSTIQGGRENFNSGLVSTRLVSRTESDLQGGFIHTFYSGAPVGDGDKFIVIPLGGISGYFDKKGLWHEY